MDVKLESLIAKIKQNGIEEAKKAAGDIIKEAKSEAEAIVKEASLKAKGIEDQARTAAAKLKSNSQDSLKQASRDLILGLKAEIVALFDRVLKQKCGLCSKKPHKRELELPCSSTASDPPKAR